MTDKIDRTVFESSTIFMFFAKICRSSCLVVILIFLFCTSFNVLSAQLSVTASNAALDPEALVETFFLGDGVEVTNIDYTGDNNAVGFFTDGINEIDMDRGLVMGSGFVADVVGAYLDFASTDTGGPNGDSDLENITDVAVNDVSFYEITFIPTADTLRFRYVFASEEYPDYNCSVFNDVFGFFITGPNPLGGSYAAENIALVPELSDPSGLTFTNLPVSIANVHGAVPANNCPGSFEEYYNDNSGSVQFAYGAYLDVFTAQAIVIPCEEYTIKLAIADGADQIFDSAVFLEAKSFGTGSLNIDIQTVSLDGSIAEGCNSGTIVFSLPNPQEEDVIVDAVIIDCPGSATLNEDYFGLPNQIVIPAGETSVSYEVFAVDEGIVEGDEFICFDIQRDICNRDTVSIRIVESPLTGNVVYVPNDTTICQNETVFLNTSLPPSFILPPAPSFEMSTNSMIMNELVPNTFPIDVSGVVPEFLANGVIKSVCIDTLEHRFLTDMDVFLITPSGQFLELTTDNGKKPLNGLDVDYYINTCFTPFALTEVENGSSLSGPIFNTNPTYEGDFFPEGVWNDLYGPERESNGTYELLIIDDETGALGRFTGWSICFNPIYNLTYNWSSDIDGDICTNCEGVPIDVTENTTFYLEVIDSYGCGYLDSFTVTTNTLLPGVTNLMCDSISQDYISFTWDGEPTADSYEIFIPGVIDPAIDIGDVTEYAVDGLLPLVDYSITVRSIGGICGGESVTIVCSTINCNVDDLIIEAQDSVVCFGEANGLLDVDITGVFPPFTYQYRGESNLDGLFTGLAAGEDTLYITDNVGCVSKYPIEILQPNSLNVDFDGIIAISCFNENDGRAVAEPFGGVAPYEVLWSSGEMTEVAALLSPGTNFITITDDNGCELVESIDFDNPPELTADHLSMDASCFGTSTGIGIINPGGGTSPYFYNWGDPLNQLTQQANDLAAGTYIVTVEDINNCSTTEEVIIGEPGQIVTNVTGSSISCFNSLDGEAEVTIQGGNPPFDILWDTGSSDNPVLDLTAGWHYVTVTDNMNCEAIDSVEILAPDSIEVIFDNSDVSCFGLTDGEVSWMVTGGTGAITVTDLNNDVVTSPVSDLPAGIHCFSFEDSEGCVLDSCITLIEPVEIVIDYLAVFESCFNTNDASIDITVSMGVEPYTFSWTGPNNFTSNNEDIFDINSGQYFIEVTDANGCIKVDSLTLDEPEQIIIGADIFNIACKGEADGILQITVTGGVEPYTYNWIGPNGFTSDEEDLIDVLAGTYTLILIDDIGCTVQKQYEIIEPFQGIQAGISPNDEVCFDAKNGVASVQPFGGTLPYDITWSNDSKFTNINGLSPGWYYVTIVDGSNCSVVDSVEIIERPQIEIETSQSTSLCFESFDGSARVESITVNGVVQDPNDYEYLWNSFPLQTTQEALNLKGGADYLVVVTDQLGCTARQSVIIDTPEEVEAELSVIDSINCAQGDDGSIMINGIGGSSPYSYQWGQKTNFQTGPEASNLRAGTYLVTITDTNGCTGVEEFSIQDPFPISLNYRIFEVLCFGEEDGEVELIANGGTLPYTYNWSTGDSDDVIENLDEGLYYVTVSDANDCEIVDSVEVAQPLSPISIDASVNNITCADGQDGSIIVNASGGSGNYIYSLDNFIYNGSVEQIGLSEGTYTLYVKDANGCIDSIENIDIFSPVALELELGPDIYLSYGENFQFDPLLSNFQNPLSFEWKSPDKDLLSCDDCLNPFYEAIKQASFQLIVIDSRGCLVEDFINIYITNDDAVRVPTGFTPNGDFNNDILTVYGRENVKIIEFKVYDRWGELMYSNEDFLVNDDDLGWDGTFRDQEMPPGVYTWYVNAELTNGFSEVYSGNTTLIR